MHIVNALVMVETFEKKNRAMTEVFSGSYLLDSIAHLERQCEPIGAG